MKVPLCKCGCGDYVKWCKQKKRWNTFLLGHYQYWKGAKHVESAIGRKVGGKLKRHWFILRRRGYREIICLLSAFSEGHILRNIGLKEKNVVIQKAKRWHIARVFSGAPVFRDYKAKYRYTSEDINALVENEFHTLMDGEKILVKVIG